jgi:alkylated DNA repair dioxygenase AlkB
LRDDAAPPALGGPRLERLTGVRQLMLGSHCVYDLAERRVRRVARSSDFSLWARDLLLLAPDGRSLVRLGSPDSAQRNAAGEPVKPPPHLMVLDLDPVVDPTDLRAGGRWQALPLDRRTMRYADDSEIDRAWVEHHFRWQRDAGGRDRLVARSGVVPLPWRGRIHPNYSQYELQAAVHDPAPVLAEFLERRFAARRLPPSSAEDTSRRYSLRGETLVLFGTGLHVEQAASYWPGQTGDPAVQRALVLEIGTAFNAELAAGRHLQLFAAAR